MTKQQTLIAEPAQDALTPSRVSELMELAIREGGEGAVAVLERLVGVAERVADRQACMAFNAAFASFREAMPPVVKSRTRGGGAARDGGPGYTWWYAPIEQLMEIAEPHLRANGLYLSWGEDASHGDATTVTCTLHHAGGHSRSARATIRKGSKNKKLTPGQLDAGALTSAMRRALGMVLGIVTSDPEDPDAEPQGQPISEEQSIELDTLLSQLKNPESAKRALLKWLRADALMEIRSDDFAAAQEKLLGLIEKEAQG